MRLGREWEMDFRHERTDGEADFERRRVGNPTDGPGTTIGQEVPWREWDATESQMREEKTSAAAGVFRT